MNNEIFRRTMENVRNHINIMIITEQPKQEGIN